MKHILCIHLRNWPVARCLRKRSPSREAISSPLLITHVYGNRTLVVACDDAAHARGIQPGQTLAQARAHHAAIQVEPWRPADDARGLEALARYLMRFTPVVALSTCDATDLFSTSHTPDPWKIDHWLYLDLTGCEHLHGGLEPMLAAIHAALRRLGVPANLAVAATPGAAYALTCAGEGARPSPPTSSLPGSLPIHSLRLDDKTIHLLSSLGITTLSQLLKLPRKQLASRFGPLLLKRMDQASGELPEPLVPLPCYRPIEGRMDFEWPIAQPEAIEEAFKHVLAPMLEECHRRAIGLRELRITLPRIDAPPLSLQLRFSRPTRNQRLPLNLFRCCLEQQQLAMTKPLRQQRFASGGRRYERQSLEFPFTSILLKATQLASLSESQLAMGEPAADHDAAWQETLDRLRMRFGQTAVQQARLAESYMPERAFELRPAGEEDDRAAGSFHPAHRPLSLFPSPREIQVTVSPSDDRDGRPIQFRDPAFHEVTNWVGPERLAGAWWDGRNKTRDYFDVEDQAGRRYWIFRVQENNRWFMHGVFA